MGQCLGIVSSPLDGCVSFTPFRLSSVASALSLSERWLSFSSGSVGSSGAVPRGNFEVPMRVGSSSSLHGLSSD